MCLTPPSHRRPAYWEAGGLTTREAFQALRATVGSNFIGGNVVEVSPSYDHAEITTIAAGTIALKWTPKTGHRLKVEH